MRSVMNRVLVSDLAATAPCVVDVEAKRTVGEVLETLDTLKVLSVPVYVLKNDAATQWADVAGLECGAKKYVGIVSVLDLVGFLLRTSGHYGAPSGLFELDEGRVALAMQAPVTQALGSTLESLVLWVEPAQQDGLWALAYFSRGVHRALVVIDGAVKLVTQADIVRYLASMAAHTWRGLEDSKEEAPSSAEMEAFLATPLGRLDASWATKQPSVISVLDTADLVASVHTMVQHQVSAVAVLDAASGRVLHTLSASDLRGSVAAALPSMAPLTVCAFLNQVHHGHPPPPLTCTLADTLATAVDTMMRRDVHRVWVVDDGAHQRPLSVFTLSDVIFATYQNELRLFHDKTDPTSTTTMPPPPPRPTHTTSKNTTL